MSLYEQSQQAILEAESAQRDGDGDRAMALFEKAANLQRQYVDSLPTDRVRTRSVYGLSVATLLYKARRLDQAERTAHGFLSQSWLEPYSANKFRELLTLIWDERLLLDLQVQMPAHPISMFFRGGHVLRGTAPAEPVEFRSRTMRSLANRCGAYKNKKPLTKIPEASIKDMYQAWDRHGTGSYRIDMFFTAPAQMMLDISDMRSPVSPSEVMETALEILYVVTHGDASDLTALIPDPAYRLAFVRLARNLLPDGYEIGEIELSIGASRSSRVVLKEHHKWPLNAMIREFHTPHVATKAALLSEPVLVSVERRAYSGTLRAVDLDVKKIRVELLGGGTGSNLNLTNDLLLDDVLGPMLNKFVSVTETRRQGSKKWSVENIELAAPRN